LTFYVTGVHIKNYNVKREADGSFHYLSKLREVDWAGACTLVISVALFMLATSLGGNSLPWSHPLVIGSLSGSAVGVVLFTVVEAKYAKYPIMPWPIITQRTPLASSFTNFWSLMCSMSLVFLVPLYFQSILGFSASKAGVYMLPKILASSAGSLIAGYYMSHTGHYKGFCICSGISLILGAAIITSWTPQSSAWWMALGNILDGYALGSLLTTTLVSLLAAVEVKGIVSNAIEKVKME
jgi:Fungal trichothecene efflux pump (TRI12)